MFTAATVCQFPTCRKHALPLLAILPTLFALALVITSAGLRVRADLPLAISLTLTSALVLALILETVAIVVHTAKPGTAAYHARLAVTLAGDELEVAIGHAVEAAYPYVAATATGVVAVALLAVGISVIACNPLTALTVAVVVGAGYISRQIIDRRNAIAAHPATPIVAEVAVQVAGWTLAMSATVAVSASVAGLVIFAIANPMFALAVGIASAIAAAATLAIYFAPLMSQNADLMYADVDLGLWAMTKDVAGEWKAEVVHAKATAKAAATVISTRAVAAASWVKQATKAAPRPATSPIAAAIPVASLYAAPIAVAVADHGMDAFSTDPAVYAPYIAAAVASAAVLSAMDQQSIDELADALEAELARRYDERKAAEARREEARRQYKAFVRCLQCKLPGADGDEVILPYDSETPRATRAMARRAGRARRGVARIAV